MISIFVEFIDQLIDYPINCASLNIQKAFLLYYMQKAKAENSLASSQSDQGNIIYIYPLKR